MFLSKYFSTAYFFGMFLVAMIIFFPYQDNDSKNLLVPHIQQLLFTTTICICIPKYYIHQNENLTLYVKLYHQIPAPVLPWQLPENFDLKSVTLVVHKSKKMPWLWTNLFCTPDPSITDGVHRNENFVAIIPVFSTFSNFKKKEL